MHQWQPASTTPNRKLLQINPKMGRKAVIKPSLLNSASNLASPLYRLSCGFTFGVLKGVGELIQFLVRHAKSQACFTPLGEGALYPAQYLVRPHP
jgi:hypothetical protein